MSRKEQREAQAEKYARLNGKTEREKYLIELVSVNAARMADETFLDKAIDVLIEMSNEGKIELHNHEEFEKNFRKAMEE